MSYVRELDTSAGRWRSAIFFSISLKIAAFENTILLRVQNVQVGIAAYLELGLKGIYWKKKCRDLFLWTVNCKALTLLNTYQGAKFATIQNLFTPF